MSENRYRKRYPEDEEIQETQEANPEELTPEEEAQVGDGLFANEEVTYKKRYGDLRRHQQQREAQLQARIQELEKGSTTAMPSTKEEVEEWVKTYPDLAKILKTLMKEEIQTSIPQPDTSTSERIQQLELTIQKQKAIAILTELHPDFRELQQDNQFREWVKKQPSNISDALLKGLDPYAAARAVDLYKSDLGIAKKAPAKQDNRSAASSVARTQASAPSGKGAVWSESRIEAMSQREYEKHEKEILEAMAKGEFVYDINGGAR